VKTKNVPIKVIKKPITVVGNSPADMIRMAVTGKANLTELKELLAIQRDWEANEARKIFTASFATAQANIAGVVKTKTNQHTHSKYADLSDIIKSAQPIYTKEGFSIIFYEGETKVPDNIRICADVLHRAGHKETYHYDIPLDGAGIQGNANMTKIHGKGSSTSYARRYLMCMIWNIPTQDDDGIAASSPIELIDEKQLSQLLDILDNPTAEGKKISKVQFLAYLKVEKLEELLKADFKKALVAAQNIAKGGKP
jgi:hypothetical protein